MRFNRFALPPIVTAPLLALAAVALLAGPAVLSGERALASRDLFHYYYPIKARLADSITKGGGLPLWEPAVGAGVPYLADPTTSALYPGTLLYRVLPLGLAFNAAILLHAGIAAAGAAAWAGALGAGRVGATVAGLVYALNGVALSLHNHPIFLQSGAWLPFALLAFRRCREAATRRGRMWWLTATAGTLALELFGGAVELVLATAVLLGLDSAAAVFTAPERRWRALARELTRLALTGALAIGLGATQLLPSLELAAASDRAASGGLPLDVAGAWSFHPAQLPELLVPFFYGNYPRDGTYWGAFLLNPPTGPAPLTASAYFGPTVVLLAAAGLLVARSRGLALREAALVVALLLLAFGVHTPAFAVLHRWVPGFALFRYPAKFLYLVALPLSILAGLGAAAWLETGDGRAGRVLRVGAAAALLVFTAALLLPWTGRPRATTEGLVHALAAAAGLCLVAWLLRPDRVGTAARLARPALVLLVTFDLAVAGRDLFLSVPRAMLDDPPPAAATLARLAATEGGPQAFRIARLAIPLDAGPHAARGDFPALRERHRAILQPNLASHFGLHDADHVGAVRLGRYEALWRGLAHRTDLALRLVGARFVLEATPADPPGGRRGLGWRHRPDALPRSVVVFRATVVRSPAEALARLRAHDFDPSLEVVLETTAAGGSVGVQTAATGRARIVAYAPARVEVEAEVDRPGWLVLHDTFYPGWRARVGAHEAPIEPANLAFRAVRLPGAGRHTVVFEYRPGTVTAGVTVSVLTAVALAGALTASRWGWPQSC